jgi:hypothetical protein
LLSGKTVQVGIGLSPALAILLGVGARLIRPQPGDYLLDESRNFLTDESGNKLTA